MHPSVKMWRGNYQVVTVYTLKAYRRSTGTDPLILNFGSEWSQVSNFTLLPLYLWGKNPDTRWIGDLVGHQSKSGCFGEADELHKFMKLHWLFFNYTTVATKLAWYEHLQDGCNFATQVLMLDLFKNFGRWKLCWLKIFWLLSLKLSS